MDRRSKRVAALGGAVAVVVVALAPPAGAGTTSVGYGSCTSSNPSLSAPPITIFAFAVATFATGMPSGPGAVEVE